MVSMLTMSAKSHEAQGLELCVSRSEQEGGRIEQPESKSSCLKNRTKKHKCSKLYCSQLDRLDGPLPSANKRQNEKQNKKRQTSSPPPWGALLPRTLQPGHPLEDRSRRGSAQASPRSIRGQSPCSPPGSRRPRSESRRSRKRCAH